MIRSSRPPFPFTLLWFWFLRILPAWLGMAAIIFLMQLAVAAIVHDNANVKTFLVILKHLPSIVRTAIGGDLVESGSMTALLTVGYQHPLVMFLYLLYAVGVPAGLLTGEIQRGTMELILSRPITKTQVYICAAILTLVGLFGLISMMFLGTVASVNIYTFNEPVALDIFLRLSACAALLAGSFGAFSLLCAASFARLYLAGGIAAGFLTLNYFIAIVSEWWPRVHFLHKATLFYLVYYSNLWYAWPLENMAWLGGILIALVILGGIIWRCRDLPS
jgi:ABC-type transport system involved in multi-copper enzyme maturation permease subunit